MTIHTFVLGPIKNNTYLIVDNESRAAALIDPAAPTNQITSLLDQQDLILKYILITHAHFDHITGVKWARTLSKEHIPVTLHNLDIDLWKDGGGSRNFGFELDAGPVPDVIVADQQVIQMNGLTFTVLHTPGHSRGHVTYYFPAENTAFCGDLIFRHGVGRTDLEGCSTADLMKSIHEKIFTMPDDTILYPGHGEATTVEEEKENNPFL
jgi:glyoxylase-like metal-dependent hydrolase (beta-lactamase superfamily II)